MISNIIIAYMMTYDYGNLSEFPDIFTEGIQAFVKEIRSEKFISAVFELAEHNYVPPSRMRIAFTILDTEGDSTYKFDLKLINVREFRAEWEKRYERELSQGKKLKMR